MDIDNSLEHRVERLELDLAEAISSITRLSVEQETSVKNVSQLAQIVEGLATAFLTLISKLSHRREAPGGHDWNNL